MARILNSPLSISTVTFEYLNGSTVSQISLDSTSFGGGGGSGTTYSAGTGLTLNATTFNHSNNITAGSVGNSQTINSNVFLVPSLSYDSTGHITNASNTTVTVPTTNTITSDGTAFPTASAVYTFGNTLAAGAYVFSASLVAATVTLDGGANIASVCQAFELGTSPVYIWVNDVDNYYMYYVTYVYDRPSGYTVNAIAVPSVTSSYMQIACLFGSSMSSTQTYIGRQVFTLNS